MIKPRFLRLIGILLCGMANFAGLRAQQSPIAELLTNARAALDNLQYPRAASIARSVLALGPRASRIERVEALQLAAAALYPDEPRAQQGDSARLYLRQLVRLSPDRDLPGAVSWPGLDSLLVAVRTETFGAIARPRRDNVIVGAASLITIPVTATREAWFRLVGVPTAGGTRVPLDSAGPVRDAMLRFAPLDGSVPRLPTGDYILLLTVVDSSADTLEVEYSARVDAPALAQVSVPLSLDSSKLLPERARPSRGRTIGVGVGLGAATVLLATVLRGEQPIRSSTPIASSAYAAGAGLSIGTILWGLRDRGAPIAANIAANAQLRSGMDRVLRAAQIENDRLRTGYSASITIDPEPRK